MSVKKRFLEHLEAAGKIPKGFCSGGMAKGYAEGGVVQNEDEWEDSDDWNSHDDTSGEPETFGDNYMEETGYAFGGRIEADRHMTSDPTLHGQDYGKPNFSGPEEHTQANQDMSEDEVRRHLAQAIRAKRSRAG